jgi:hypothetical protein
MQRRFNYAVAQGPGGVEWEADMATCGHCQKQMKVPPAKEGHIITRVLPPCVGCGHYICDECVKTPGCKTWEQKMDETEARERSLLRALNG